MGQDGGAPAAADVQAAALASVADRALRRAAALGPDAPALAAAMAALGATGRLADAAAVAGLDERRAAAAAHGLRRLEILAAEDPFEWGHPLVRRSVYDELTVGAPRRAARPRRRGARAHGRPRRGRRRPRRRAPVRLARDGGHPACRRRRGAHARRARGGRDRAAPRAGRGRAEPPRASLLRRLGELELLGRDPEAVTHLRRLSD